MFWLFQLQMFRRVLASQGFAKGIHKHVSRLQSNIPAKERDSHASPFRSAIASLSRS
jgi:hypothetical protein